MHATHDGRHTQLLLAQGSLYGACNASTEMTFIAITAIGNNGELSIIVLYLMNSCGFLKHVDISKDKYILV